MHAGFGGREDLHSVHAEVLVAGIRIFGVYAWEGDETSAVLRPALKDGEVEQGWERSRWLRWLGWVQSMNDVLTRAGRDVSGFGVEQSESLEGEVPR
jgi:hypothetical protein